MGVGCCCWVGSTSWSTTLNTHAHKAKAALEEVFFHVGTFSTT